MPRWRKLCKNGEQPTRFIESREFENTFGIRTWIPGGERNGCCASCVPEEWVPAVKELVEKIRTNYKLVGLDDNTEGTDVNIAQIKDKFGALRFYYDTNSDFIYKQIDIWIKECEKKLKKADPYYAVPY